MLAGASDKDARAAAEQRSCIGYRDAACEYFNESHSQCLNSDFVKGLLSPASSSSSTSLQSLGSAKHSFCPRKHNESFGRALSSIVLRQLKDDDSLAGNFDRHQFLDDASRDQWNPQVGRQRLSVNSTEVISASCFFCIGQMPSLIQVC